MRLLNTNRRLPGGWRYEQLDASGKSLHKFQSWDPWMMFLGQVQGFRKANKLIRSDIDDVEKDVTEYLAREFGGDPQYFTMNPAQKKTSLSSRFQSRGAALVARGRQLFNGANVLADWLGDGLKPVSPEEAQNRANICKGCPRNNPGFKPVETIAAIIRAWSEKKNELRLEVIGEDKLHTCDLCWCDLKTKVHVPMPTIVDRTPQAMFEKFETDSPKNCWMRQHKT